MKKQIAKITWTTNDLSVTQCAAICDCTVAKVECKIACTHPDQLANEALSLWDAGQCDTHAALRSMHRMAIDRRAYNTV
ncbi:hypothetical protein [Noviherbaspirillum malthae]|uniref:hypothetical protein n=1 Tax=Noviherbaspirillum malthae TaxID=1260987 RepID=UPI00188E7E5A|nr:hypothetical protein [Noviherbaspirillum malthae]